MECPVCLEGYTGDASLLPKLLPCVHFACVGCLRRVQHCPKCRKEFTGSADALPTAFDLIGGRERSGDNLSGWWCTECLSPAAAQCRVKHLILGVQEALRRQAAKLAPLASEAVRGLEDAVQAAAEEPACMALQMLSGPAPAECELTVRRGGSAVGAQWRLEEGGAASGLMARTLLCQLAAEGTLQDKSAALGTPQAPPQAVKLEEPCLPDLALFRLSIRNVSGLRLEKEEVLQRVQRHGVLRIRGLYCNSDPAWSLQLLQASTASLEELQVMNPRPEHLLAAHNAPRLRRLEMNYVESRMTVDVQSALLPALAAPSNLQWLRVYRLPRAPLESLLRAHAASLHTVGLLVGTPGEDVWPLSCPDLDALLDCGLVALRSLLLIRPVGGHKKLACRKQVLAVRCVLPAATVQCNMCETFTVESF